MAKLQKVEEIVERVLDRLPVTRDDDFLLIYNVYKYLNEETAFMDFRRIMRDHKVLGLPSFESITRARRKIQSENPELSPSKKAKKVRQDEERAFRSYAISSKDLPF